MFHLASLNEYNSFCYESHHERGSPLIDIIPLASEDTEHLCFDCKFLQTVWKWLHNWSSILPSPPKSLSDLSLKMCFYGLRKRFKRMKLGLIYSTIWMISKARNTLVFKKMRWSFVKTADEIQFISYKWFKHRVNLNSLNWNVWCRPPMLACNNCM